MVMTAGSEEVSKTADGHLSFQTTITNRLESTFPPHLCKKIKFVLDSRQPFENGRIFNLAVGLERVRRIEHATLKPLVFTCTGGAGPAATQCLKRLGSQLADKHQMAYSQAMGWLICRLSFALLRSSILCLRGAHGSSEAEFPPSASRGPGRRRHVLTFLTQI